jgi:hypothetical protein
MNCAASPKLNSTHNGWAQQRDAEMNLLLPVGHSKKFIMNGRFWAAQGMTGYKWLRLSLVLRFHDNVQIGRAVCCDGMQMLVRTDRISLRSDESACACVCVCLRELISDGSWSSCSEPGVMSPTPQRRCRSTAFPAHLLLLVIAGNWRPSANTISWFLLLRAVHCLTFVFHYTSLCSSLCFAVSVSVVSAVCVHKS